MEMEIEVALFLEMLNAHGKCKIHYCVLKADIWVMDKTKCFKKVQIEFETPKSVRSSSNVKLEKL